MVSSFIAMKPPYIYISQLLKKLPIPQGNQQPHNPHPSFLCMDSSKTTYLRDPLVKQPLFLKNSPSQKTLFALVTFSNFNDMRDHPSNAKWRLPCRQVKPNPHAFSEGKNGVWFEKSPLPYGKTREDLFAFIEYTTK